MIQDCVNENARIVQDQIEYQKRYNSLVEKYDTLKEKYDSLEQDIAKRHARYEILGHFIKTLKEQKDMIIEFDDVLWGSLLDYITVYNKDDVRFTFKDGTEIRV